MKNEMYMRLSVQASSLIEGEKDETGVMANIAALIKEATGHHWVGFYVVKENDGKKELTLGPFQGPVACYRIGFGKGVCGSAWERKETMVVPDVDAFPGHIACSSLSRSEIVVPLFRGDEVRAVLDIDSASLNSFDETDRIYLEKICGIISKEIY